MTAGVGTVLAVLAGAGYWLTIRSMVAVMGRNGGRPVTRPAGSTHPLKWGRIRAVRDPLGGDETPGRLIHVDAWDLSK